MPIRACFRCLVLGLAVTGVGGISDAAENGKSAKPVKSAPPAKPAKPQPPAPVPAKPPAPAVRLEPICVAIEPLVLKTAAARMMKGAKATVLSPATEVKDGLKILSQEEWAALGMTWDDFLLKAAAAASRHLSTLTPELKKDSRGVVEYAILKSERHLTAATILCPEFRLKFKEFLGPDLLVLVPDRFTVFVFPRRTGDFQKLGAAVASLYEDAVFPASSEAFELNENGMKAIGSFLTGDEDTESRSPAGDRSLNP